MRTPEYPWYDASWLMMFNSARALLAERYPDRLDEFESAFEGLRTRPDFETVRLNGLLDEHDLQKCREQIAVLNPDELDKREFFQFGRVIKHDLPLFVEMQNRLADRVSELVGEELEPSYNFLSLYNNFGICDLHLDAPNVKWTLDICIEQTAEWPLNVSEVVPWPETANLDKDDWAEKLIFSENVQFSQYTHQPGDGVLFSGSSQWHYRDRIPNQAPQNLVHLIFFHYFPKGMRELVFPECWADRFEIPDLNLVAGICGSKAVTDFREFERQIA